MIYPVFLNVLKIDNYQITINNLKESYLIKEGEKIDLTLRIATHSTKKICSRIFFVFEERFDHAFPQILFYEIVANVFNSKILNLKKNY